MKVRLSLKDCLIVCIFVVAWSKTVQKIIPISDFESDGQTYFVTKFDIGIGRGQAVLTFKQLNVVRERDFPKGFSIGLLPYQNYQKFKSTNLCSERSNLMSPKIMIGWDDYLRSHSALEAFQKDVQQIWYVYLFNCQVHHQQFKNRSQSISIKVQFLNNGSHFGEDEQTFIPYLILVGIWVFIIIKFGIPIFKTFSQERPDMTRIIIYAGLFTLGIAYFYKLLHLLVYAEDGMGFKVLIVLAITLKNVTQAIMVTMIVSIGWGWSIVHLKHDQSYIITGTISALINITGLVLDLLAEQMEEDHHQYDSTSGFIVVIMRFILFGIFIIGIFRSMASSYGTVRNFLKSLGIVGSIYLLSWPLAVIFSEMLLPPYMHHEVITFVEEFIHLLVMICVCQMVSYPQTYYRKISKKDEDNPLDPDKGRLKKR